MAKKIAILGAGVAGLSAAYELQRIGHQVVVLEARDFPGGRVQTIRKPFADGLYAEAAATIIPQNHSATWRYIREFDLAVEPHVQSEDANIYFIRGKRLSQKQPEWPFALKEEEKGLLPSELIKKYLDSVPPNFSLDQVSFSDLLRKQGASDNAIELMRLEYIEEWGEGIDSYSALSGLHDLSHGHIAPFYRIRGGTDLLPNAFASRLKDILYNTAVVRIEQRKQDVEIHFKKDSQLQSLTADFVVCTIPFSVLKYLEFAFSEAKTKLIHELPYTSVSRIYLQFRERVWHSKGFTGQAYTDLPIMSVFHDTSNQPGKRGILECYISGEKSRAITRMKASDRVGFGLRQMEKVFPGIRIQYESGYSQCWDEDPWARGAYSWFRPGDMRTVLPLIAKPEGRIHFAGDHTSDLPGWMQGALSSGMRAADEIAVLAHG